jgi:hypothetical protein
MCKQNGNQSNSLKIEQFRPGIIGYFDKIILLFRYEDRNFKLIKQKTVHEKRATPKALR